MTGRKRRIYLSIIALSALGWLVDRLAMPTPVSAVPVAAAPPPRVPAPALSPGLGAAPGGKPALLAATRFPEKLPSHEPPSRDLFGPTDTARSLLIGQVVETSGAGGGAALNDARLLAERFPDAHVLSAVVNDGALSVAVLDGSWMRVGAEIDGCTLQRIDGQRVEFDCAGVVVELSVGQPAAPD